MVRCCVCNDSVRLTHKSTVHYFPDEGEIRGLIRETLYCLKLDNDYMPDNEDDNYGVTC